jgi:hypothetical protein
MIARRKEGLELGFPTKWFTRYCTRFCTRDDDLRGGGGAEQQLQCRPTMLLRPIHTFHAVPRPCPSAKALECVFPFWFTQFGHVWFTHTMPFPCHATNTPFWKRPLKAMAGSWQGDGMGTACWRPASFRPIPATTRSSRTFVIRSIPISDAGGQCETKQRLSWTRRSLLFWCKDMSACIIYSTKIMITI